MEEFNEAQLMWFDIIYSVLRQPRLNVKIGDLNYVLSNMIAKFVSSSDRYLISERALAYGIDRGVDFSRPVHIKSAFYGKHRDTILEHMIPANIIRAALIKMDLVSMSDVDGTIELKKVLGNSGRVAIVMREEDDKLNSIGLRNKMPNNWSGFGDNPIKRYDQAGISMSKIEIIRYGPICR